MNDIEQSKETRLDQARKEMKDKPDTSVQPPRIIHKLAEGMMTKNAQQQPTDTPTDLIKEQIDKNKLLVGKGPQQVQAAPKVAGTKEDLTLPALPPPPNIVIDGHEFKRSNIPHLDAITIIMYIVGEVLSDDPRIESILKQVQFQFPDNAGNLIFPKPAKTRTRKAKAKKRNVRPSKQ